MTGNLRSMVRPDRFPLRKRSWPTPAPAQKEWRSTPITEELFDWKSDHTKLCALRKYYVLNSTYLTCNTITILKLNPLKINIQALPYYLQYDSFVFMDESREYDKLVTATFDDPDKADRATDAVVDRPGYDHEDITVLMSDELQDKHYSDETIHVEEGNKAAEGAGVGGATGGAVGGIAGALLAAGGAVLLPGIGLAISGPLAATLAGVGTGGAAGTIIGALAGAGIPEERAEHYKEDIEEGRIVLGVNPKSETDARRIIKKWKELGAYRIHTGKYRFDTETL